MFDDFDFTILDDPGYKEDAVREDLIAPLLRQLGYRASGKTRVQRSQSLIHPYVMIGSKKHSIHIIPDYTLYVDDKPVAILEAKGPSEKIINSDHVEQAYSYAIHPEVRAELYGLCNGRELVVYSMKQWEPVLSVKVHEIGIKWREVEEILHPDYILNPYLKDFMPDFGLAALKMGMQVGTQQIFIRHYLQSIMKAEDDLYVFQTTTDVGGQNSIVALDASVKEYQQFLSLLPAAAAAEISSILKRAPFQAMVNGKVTFSCAGTLGDVVQGEYEQFAPVIVTEITEAFIDQNIELTPYQRGQP